MSKYIKYTDPKEKNKRIQRHRILFKVTFLVCIYNIKYSRVIISLFDVLYFHRDKQSVHLLRCNTTTDILDCINLIFTTYKSSNCKQNFTFYVRKYMWYWRQNSMTTFLFLLKVLPLLVDLSRNLELYYHDVIRDIFSVFQSFLLFERLYAFLF
jgi:hypothetical protein